MTNKRGIYAAKFLTYLGVLAILYVVQTTPGFLSIFGVAPNLALAAAVYIAVQEGEFIGGLYGVWAGLLCDLGGFTIFGFNAILIMIFCVTAGLLSIYMLRRTIQNYVGMVFAAMLIRGLLDYLLNYYMWGYEQVWRVLTGQILPCVIYTTAASPLCFYLLGWIYRWFSEKIDPQRSVS